MTLVLAAPTRGSSAPPTAAALTPAERFDRRIRFGVTVIASALLVAAPAHFAIDGNTTFLFCTLACAVICLVVPRVVRDGCELILTVHPTVMFLFMTYLYATLHGRPVTQELYEPDVAAMIALVYQLGVLGGATVALGLGALIKRPDPSRDEEAPGFARIRLVLIVFGFAAFFAGRRVENAAAVGSLLSQLMWLGVAAHLVGRRRLLPLDLVTGSIAVGTFLVAMLANTRAAFLETLLFFAFAHLMYSPRVATFLQFVAGVIAIRALAVFSDIMLTVRWLREISPQRMFEEAMDQLLSLEFLYAVFNPTYEHSATVAWASAVDERNLFWTPFFEGNISLLQRFTVLPQMDIILQGVGVPDRIKWPEVTNIVYSLLPSLGQQKDLILSDRITWDIGLRAAGNIGRPMVTAAGEHFVIGGYFGVLALGIILIGLFILSLRIFRAVVGSNEIVTLLFSQLVIYTLVTTTALSAYAVVTRTIPALIFVALVLKYVFPRVASSVSDQARQPVAAR